MSWYFGDDPAAAAPARPSPPGGSGGWKPTQAQIIALLKKHPKLIGAYLKRHPELKALFAPKAPTGGGRRHAPPPPVPGGGGGGGGGNFTEPTTTAPMQSTISGELSLRHMPDGRVVITHEAHGEMGCEGDVDNEGFCEDTAPSQVRYHMSRMDAFGPTHYGPGDFGFDLGQTLLAVANPALAVPALVTGNALWGNTGGQAQPQAQGILGARVLPERRESWWQRFKRDRREHQELRRDLVDRRPRGPRPPGPFGYESFGIDAMHQDIDTEGLPLGPIGDIDPAGFRQPSSFGLDETFYPYGYELALLFGEEDDDLGCMKG